MKQIVNEEYESLFTKKPRYFLMMGGRGAGRSTVASQFALAKLVAPEYFRCAIMRYILGDIRNSIYREITDRAEETGVTGALDIADNSMTITHGANSINAVGFRKSSGDQKAKLKSLANYNCVIIEEADEIPEADFMQLDDSLRTLKGDITIILLLNPPPREHWIIERWFDLLPSEVKNFYKAVLKESAKDAIYLHTTFRHNLANLSEKTVNNYLSYKDTRPDHYYNMIEGLVPEMARGRIFNGWLEVESIPHEARLERIGVDFGYSNDPTAIIAIYYYNGGYILDEIAYQKGLSGKQIADILLMQGQVTVIGDSADPRLIDEIRSYGVTILPCVKGTGSVLARIQLAQGERLSYTARSVNVKKEYTNYAWVKDKEGRYNNEPEHMWSHSMDAFMYALESISPVMRKKEFLDNWPKQELRRAPINKAL